MKLPRVRLGVGAQSRTPSQRWFAKRGGETQKREKAKRGLEKHSVAHKAQQLASLKPTRQSF